MSTGQQTTGELKSISMRQLYYKGVFDSLSLLKVSKETGFPFISLVKKNKQTGKNSVANIWFAKDSGKTILSNFEPGQSVSQVLSNCDIVETISQQEGHEGELRYKIVLPSEKSKYESKSNVEAAFGMRENEETFDIKAFSETFAELTAVTVPSEA